MHGFPVPDGELADLKDEDCDDEEGNERDVRDIIVFPPSAMSLYYLAGALDCMAICRLISTQSAS